MFSRRTTPPATTRAKHSAEGGQGMSFQGVDFLNLDEELADEERMIRDEVRRWVGDQLLPNIVRQLFQPILND